MKAPIKNFSKEGVRNLLCILTIIGVMSSSCTKSENMQDESLKKSSAPATTSSIDNSITNRLLPPSSVRSSFSSSPNPAISDDFNDATVDMNKWQYRTDGSAKWATDPSYVYIATNGTQRFLSLKGSYLNQKGSGITTKTTTKYGFYIAKWKLSGIDGSYNIWHPAIWGGPCDYTNSQQGNCIDEFRTGTRQWLEADIMETYEGSAPGWASHMLFWDQINRPNAPHKAVMIAKNAAFPTSTTNWEILGMEYRPTYIKMWRFDWNLNTWTEVNSVPITTGAQSPTNMNVNNRTPLYWILSNNLLKPGLTDPPKDGDSWLHVDYFYHYNYIGQ